ncbi:MAG: acyltransferase [Methylacidiphilales bacterium]|nr:acyltransferase [Candidatus Methylacidiphilales bacterium]NJR19301.1 acyltransferase [Calothrix sp. CSU_2_0]
MRIYSNQSRLFCIDFLKAVSIVAIVSSNSIFVPLSTYKIHADFLETLFTPLRFCIPVFFTVSFFLLGRQLDNQGNQKKSKLLFQHLQHVFILTLFWFAIATVFKFTSGSSIIEICTSIYQGTIFPDSYYLLVILQLFPVCFILRRWLRSDYSVLILIVLQWLIFFGIYISLTGSSTQGIVEVLKNLNRPLIIYWLVYIALGIFIYRQFHLITSISKGIELPTKVFLLCLMSIIFMFDYQWLIKITNGTMQPFDYATISCILSAIAMFLCFASIRETHLSISGEFFVKLLSKYSLGIFCINGILSQVFFSVGTKLFYQASFSLIEILAIKLISWIVLLILSLSLSVLLARCGLKRMVC